MYCLCVASKKYIECLNNYWMKNAQIMRNSIRVSVLSAEFLSCGWSCSVGNSMWVNILITVQHCIPLLLQSVVISMRVSLQGVCGCTCVCLCAPAYQSLCAIVCA